MAQIPSINIKTLFDDIEESGCFGRSEQLLKLLRYLIEHALEKEKITIKQYSIALDVFGRDEDFDPSHDSIVRVEMHRLRAAIKRYNAVSKKYKLTLPVGSFVVAIDNVKSQVSVQNEFGLNEVTGDHLHSPTHISSNKQFEFTRFRTAYVASLLLLAVAATSVAIPTIDSSIEECSYIAPNVSVDALNTTSHAVKYTENLIEAVIAQHSSINLIEDAIGCSKAAPNFVIEVNLVENKELQRVALKTYYRSPNSIIDFKTIMGPSLTYSDLKNLDNDIIRSTVDLVKPYGVISRYSANSEWNDSDSKAAFLCSINMHDSYSTESVGALQKYTHCLEAAQSKGTTSLDNTGLLIASYLFQHAGYLPRTHSDPFQNAEKLIVAVGDEWVESAEMVIAKLIYESERPDFYPDQLRLVLSVAEKQYDKNPHVMLTAAIRAGYKLGDWDYAKRLSDRVKVIHSERDSSVFAVDAAYALLYAPPAETMEDCIKTYAPRALLNNILVNACAVKARDENWVDKTRSNLAHVKTQDEVKEFIMARNYEPELTRALIQTISSK